MIHLDGARLFNACVYTKISPKEYADHFYKALLELDRAVRSIFICKYLISEDLRKEIDEALNVIENWHSGNKFIFFGKRGILSSNDEIDHELSILSLHLVQSSLVYINTLDLLHNRRD